jgi:hypothetical protein
MAQLELEIRQSEVPKQGFCPLCGSVFEVPPVTAVLQDGPLPLGYLCDRCLMLGPRVSAENLDERATGLRDLIDQARYYLRDSQWLLTLLATTAVHERIERHEHLAARLRELPWWTLGHGEP